MAFLAQISSVWQSLSSHQYEVGGVLLALCFLVEPVADLFQRAFAPVRD
jgi:hypothetical protein